MPYGKVSFCGDLRDFLFPSEEDQLSLDKLKPMEPERQIDPAIYRTLQVHMWKSDRPLQCRVISKMSDPFRPLRLIANGSYVLTRYMSQTTRNQNLMVTKSQTNPSIPCP